VHAALHAALCRSQPGTVHTSTASYSSRCASILAGFMQTERISALTGSRLVCAVGQHVVQVLPQLVLGEAVQVKAAG